MAVRPAGRRKFLGGLLAAGLMPRPTWADAGSPAFLSAAALANGSFVLCGISKALELRFQIPLPARGHAAAAHPLRPEAVAFARRPGTFAVVIDCVAGEPKAMLQAPPGRHFYGHGTFSATGDYLFTTENDYESGQGRVGVWDARNRYTRVDEFPSGGIGPHDIKRLPGTDVLVVANGGIDTHPETGRTKLNIPTMAPNLSYVTEGAVSETVELSPDLHKNSIRHLAVSSKGLVAFGMQWQGHAAETVGLVGTHLRTAATLRVLSALREQTRAMQGYVGSIAFGADDSVIAVTSPRGGTVQTYDARTGTFLNAHPCVDVSGVASHAQGFIVTSGTGKIRQTNGADSHAAARLNLAWDNHLVPI